MRVTGQPIGDAAHGAGSNARVPHREGGSLPAQLARIVIGALLIIAPWLFGATEEWSWQLLQCLVVVATVLAVASGCWSHGGAARLRQTWNWWWGAPMLALAAYMALQATNPSHLFFNGELLPIPCSKAWPRTIDAATTCEALVKFLTYAALFWSVRASFTERRQAWALLTALVVNGFLLALVGLSQKLAGSELLLGWRRPGNPYFLFGPFVNRNNYASYVNLLIPVACAVAHHRRHVARSAGERSDAAGLFVFMVLMMALSVIMTTSRAGIVVCGGILLGWAAIEVQRVIRSGSEARRVVLVWLIVIAVLVGALFYLGVHPVEQRLLEMRQAPAELAPDGGRGAAYQATLKMFLDSCWFGIGAGTFSMAYPYYSTERPDWFRRYAHNDWLQYLAELGLLGAALFAALVVAVVYEQWKARSRGGRLDWMATALGIGLTGVALHALVDFPLHIPSIALLVVAYAALLTLPAVRKVS